MLLGTEMIVVKDVDRLGETFAEREILLVRDIERLEEVLAETEVSLL